ncbi:glycosyl hydrolases family 31-domain-containing protein [Lipomyces arxii]|uniref:glycosyl hydrolases family 31-domain-containing protein n=1 Tax=Lipomyces arxii TaxID=56418 RepID=UPI0034CF6226
MQTNSFSCRPKSYSEAIVKGDYYRFTVLTDRLLRFEWSEDGKFEDRASTFALNRDFSVPKINVENGSELEIKTEYFHLIYDKEKFSPDGFLVYFNAKFTDWGAPWRYGTPTDWNLGGTARTLDGCDGACDIGQGILSKAGYAVIDDSRSMLFDGNGFVEGRPAGDRIDCYLFCYGHDYKGALKAFYALAGRQPVLPRYALGNWWSRYYPYRQDEYIALMDEFRTRGVPLSVAVIDMDWHLVADNLVPHSGWTGYTWNGRLFPDPGKFGRELHARDLRISLNDHPHNGIHHHEDSYQEVAEFLGHDTSAKSPILFDPANPKFLKAYLEILHRNIEKVACDFWWIDWQQGHYSRIHGADPLWILNHFHFQDQLHHYKEALIFSRYAGPGSHRYPVGFSGDTIVSWASLKFQPQFTATASNIGYGWWSHDIGGHMAGNRDDELVTRWVQFGVFSPIMRLHSSNSHWNSKEPWMYRDDSNAIITKFLQFRHRMVPFLYSCNVIGTAEDQPLVQPMYWQYPDLEKSYSVPNQYMYGRETMVVPVVEPRNSRTNLACATAWFPPDLRQVDIFSGIVYDGDCEVKLYRSLAEYPVFAHEGSIIVLDGNSRPRNGCLNPDSYEVLVVVGKSGQVRLVEDAMHDRQCDATQSEEIIGTFTFDQTSGKLDFEGLPRGEWTFSFLAMTSIPECLKVVIDGKDFTESSSVALDYSRKCLCVQLPKQVLHSTSHVSIQLGSDPQLSVLDHKARLERLIRDYQTAFEIKDNLWRVVKASNDVPLNKTITSITALGYDEEIVGPIIELLLAVSKG